MKLAIILLALGCCAYVTHQQQHFMQRRYPLPYYYNFYYDFPAQMSRKNLMMRESPLFVVRNNYVQPYQYSSSPLNPSIEDQFAMVIIQIKATVIYNSNTNTKLNYIHQLILAVAESNGWR